MENEILNAQIVDTFLGIEEHGIFTSFLRISTSAFVVEVGGYDLETKSTEFIRTFLTTLEKVRWEDLAGTYIRIVKDGDKVHKIGHIMKDKWLDFDEFFKQVEGEVVNE